MSHRGMPVASCTIWISVRSGFHSQEDAKSLFGLRRCSSHSCIRSGAKPSIPASNSFDACLPASGCAGRRRYRSTYSGPKPQTGNDWLYEISLFAQRLPLSGRPSTMLRPLHEPLDNLTVIALATVVCSSSSVFSGSHPHPLMKPYNLLRQYDVYGWIALFSFFLPSAKKHRSIRCPWPSSPCYRPASIINFLSCQHHFATKKQAMTRKKPVHCHSRYTRRCCRTARALQMISQPFSR